MAVGSRKHTMCRRIGAPLCGRENCPSLRRPYPPGMHGRRRRPHLSPYRQRLLEKQKLRAMYGIGERQLRRLFAEAELRGELSGETLLILLERRLDAVVLRLGLAATISQARQLVAHGHVLVNGSRVDRPSYLVDQGDEVRIASKDLSVARQALIQAPHPPPYLERDDAALAGRLVRLPRREEIPHPVPVDERLIVEFYAR